MQNIIQQCSYLLHNFSEAQNCKDYLFNRLNKESVDLFEFGYFPNSENINILINMIGNDLLLEKRLIYKKFVGDANTSKYSYVSFFEEHPLIMPFKDNYGDPVAIVGRSLLSDDRRHAIGISKYKNTFFAKGNYLFGLYENKDYIEKENSVYVVEGQFDLIKAAENDIRNFVALGNSNMTQYQLSLILRYTDNIYLLLDNDEAGEAGRKTILNKFGSFANIKSVYLPSGSKDVDEYLKSHSKEEFLNNIK